MYSNDYNIMTLLKLGSVSWRALREDSLLSVLYCLFFIQIKDLATSSSTKDTDYLTDPANLYISWEGVFLDHEMSHYQVSLSTFPGGKY